MKRGILARLSLGAAFWGCGALALPASRVAFLQHGVTEEDEAVMYEPETTRKTSLDPQLLSSAIARVMSFDSRATTGTALPVGNMFNRADGNVMVLVDGVQPSGSEYTPFVSHGLRHSPMTYTLRTPTADGRTTGLQSLLGEGFDVVQSAVENGRVLCAAVDRYTLEDTEACFYGSNVFSDDELNSLELGSAVTEGVTVDDSTGVWTLSTAGDGEREGAEIQLDFAKQVDLLVAKELSFLSRLPGKLKEAFSIRGTSSSPPLVIVYISSPKAIRETHAAHCPKGAAELKAIDSALSTSLKAMSVGEGRRVTSQLIAGPSLAEPLAFGGRRLATNDSSNSTSNSTGNYTLEDITQFQLNMWTGVFLFLLAFMAIYGLINMDIQPDSLLYAKFITDTSGGGLKTD